MKPPFKFTKETATTLVRDLLTHIDTLEPGKEYAVDVKRHYGQRGKDANSYAWKLIGEIAQDQGADPNDVYRSCIRKSGGTYKIFPIKPEAIEEWERIWNDGGRKVGWFVDDLGPCANLPGYNNVRSWYGSSVFTTKEMYNLIQNLRQDCEVLGLPYLTPEEEAKLLDEWPYE